LIFLPESDLIEIETTLVAKNDKPDMETKRIYRFGNARYQVRCFESLRTNVDGSTERDTYFEIRDLMIKSIRPKLQVFPFVVFDINALPSINAIFDTWVDAMRKSPSNIRKNLKTNKEPSPYSKWLQIGQKQYTLALKLKDNDDVFLSIHETKGFNMYQNTNNDRHLTLNGESLANLILALQRLESYII
jgi:hypothetical protein